MGISLARGSARLAGRPAGGSSLVARGGLLLLRLLGLVRLGATGQAGLERLHEVDDLAFLGRLDALLLADLALLLLAGDERALAGLHLVLESGGVELVLA